MGLNNCYDKARVRQGSCKKGYFARKEECTAGYEERRQECTRYEDHGQQACSQWDQRCCDWIPCRWACKLITWICIAWVWVSHWVCVAANEVRRWVCTALNVVTWFVCTAWNWVFVFPACVSWEIIKGVVVGIYEMFRPCPERYRSPDPSQPFLIVGHRGAPLKQVENTIPSYEQALSDGANALEIDLCYTRDQVVVVWHDWDPDGLVALTRQAGQEGGTAYRPWVPDLFTGMRRRVSQLTLDELRAHYGYARKLGDRVEAHIPTFGEFLHWSRQQHRLRCVILDIKVPEDEAELAGKMISAVRDELHEANVPHQVICLTPFEAVLNAMKGALDDVIYSLDVEMPSGPVLDPEAFSAVDRAIALGNRYASIGRQVLALTPWTTYRRVIAYDARRRDAHNAAVPDRRVERLLGWTIDDSKEMKCLMQLGIGGILTNKPDLLRVVALSLGVMV